MLPLWARLDLGAMDGNEGELHIPQSFRITGTSPSDCLVSYPGHSLQGWEEGILPLCREAVGVSYSPSWLSNKSVYGILNLLGAKSRTKLAVESTFLFSLTPMWLGIQYIRISLELIWGLIYSVNDFFILLVILRQRWWLVLGLFYRLQVER